MVTPDRAALVALYRATDGPNWINNENWLTEVPLGDWHGIETDQSGHVVGLVMSQYDSDAREWRGNNLSGPIPPDLGGLRGLKRLNLKANDLSGPIPPELGGLGGLERLELDGNVLTGPIPPELGSLASLTLVRLGGNNLSGPIPAELGNLAELTWLSLGTGELSGPIPAELGALTNLTFLNLSRNDLAGPIPKELGALSRLQTLALDRNGLTGEIPPELGELSRLQSLGFDRNRLTGELPPELGNLASLRSLALSYNSLTGPIPRSLSQVSGLARFGFSPNDGLCAPGTPDFAKWISGLEWYRGPFCNEADRSVLEALFETAGGSAWTNDEGWLGGPALADWHGVSADSLGHVAALDLGRNGLVGRLPRTMGQLARLTKLRIGGNPDLSGHLPSSLVDLSIRELHYPGTGLCVPLEPVFREWLNAIPSHEGTGVECDALSDRDILESVYDATGGPNWTDLENWLTEQPLDEWHGVSVDGSDRVIGLNLRVNNLTGSIPPELGSLTRLEELNLSKNELRGPIPRQLGSLASLRELYLTGNELSGPIPPELGSLANLEYANANDNELSGPIPPELGNLTVLRHLHLNDNDLSGFIPLELGGLANLNRLYLNDNELSGSIPPELGNLASLQHLDLGINELSGPLPRELGSLVDLTRLYLNDNDLSGPVPHEFGGLVSLEEFVLAVNTDMSGPLPASLTNLRSLEAFSTGGTMLCAPSDDAFLEWLAAVATRRVVPCEGHPVGAYLVQTVQSGDFPVPHVAGEAALLRVFPTATRTNQQRLPPVLASFYLDGVVVHVADLPEKPGAIPTEVDEGSLAQSVNAVIPADVIRPGLEMVVEIDPDGTLDPGLGVVKRVPETGRVSVDVREIPLLDLTVIPFLWSADPDSAVLDQAAGMAADPAGHELLELTRTLLPVRDLRVTAHEPVLSSSNDASVLFAETKAIRALEGGAGHYLGMLSGSLRGAAGLAARPGRVSFARDRSSTIAHELGHNMSLRHGTSSSCCVDPAYPYPDGTIGAWGYDFRDGGRLVPPSARDVMAGGGSESWISDYHFDKALRFHLTDEGVSGPVAPGSSLLLWGGIGADSLPYLEPAFVIDAPAALPDSAGSYRIAGRNGSGRELFSLSFTMPETADGDGNSSFAYLLPVQAYWEGDLATVTLSGPGGSATLHGNSDIPIAILRNPRTGQVRGILRDVPRPGQLARDETGQAVGPDLEVLFSRGIPDASAWRR